MKASHNVGVERLEREHQKEVEEYNRTAIS
jgi:hypothetical protein